MNPLPQAEHHQLAANLVHKLFAKLMDDIPELQRPIHRLNNRRWTEFLDDCIDDVERASISRFGCSDG